MAIKKLYPNESKERYENMMVSATDDIQSYYEELPEPVLGDQSQITGSDYYSVFKIKIIKPETLEAMQDALAGNVITAKDEDDLFKQLNS